MNDNYIYETTCVYCLKKRGMAEIDIRLESGELVSISQCLHCKMIQPQED